MSQRDLITISSSALPDGTRVAGFRCVEEISQPYQLDVFLLVDTADGDVDLADAIGAKAHLVVDRDSDALPPFVFAGVLAAVELLHEIGGRALLRAVIVPRLWQLGLSRHSRMFTKKSFPEILEAVLQDNALTSQDYELRLGRYDTEEHVCQYRESDLAFISRWMEREGIYYFFEHTEDGEKLIVCDGKPYEEDPIGAPVRYHPQIGHDGSAGASFRSFKCKHTTLPTLVKLRDYDYAKPTLDVSGQAEVSPAGAGEIVLYGERFFTPDAGKRLAKIRAEEIKAREVVYHAAGTRSHLRSGYEFELEDHPREALNQRYLAVALRHYGNQAMSLGAFRELLELPHDEVYVVEVEAIPAKTQFRAETRAAWPRIYGYENGTVDGPADHQYAQIDDQGRYAVKVKFDESLLKGGSASTFIRMMQPHGGGVEGFHFPLRKGTEVVLAFLGGDPDRPVIAGVVPNAHTPSPVTSGNHTKNVLQTGGRNRFELEDLDGQQRISLSTPYANTYIRMGAPNEEHELIVKTDENGLIDVKATTDFKFGMRGSGDWNVDVQNNWKTHVHNDNLETTVHTGDMITKVNTGDMVTTIASGNLETNVNTGYRRTIVNGQDVHVVKGSLWSVSTPNGQVDQSCKGPLTITVADSTADLSAKGKVTISSKDDIAISTPAKKITVDCTTFEDTSQQKKSVWGSVSDLATGKWTVLKLGEWVEAGVSAKLELSASAKVELALSASFSAKAGVAYEMNGVVDLKAKMAKVEQCMTKVVESPFIDVHAAAIMITCPLIQATSALKVI